MTLRRFLRILPAYLVMLHAFGMAAMAEPGALTDNPLGVICTIDGHQSAPSEPGHSDAHHVPCALCGLGACAAATPSQVAAPAPTHQPGVNARPVERRISLAAHHYVVAQPRGPPVAA